MVKTTAYTRKQQSKLAKSTQYEAKHRKAKVGKKALKPENLTDTSFKTKSLHVQKQQSLSASSTSKEKLENYFQQLKHNAPGPRNAALKGIQSLLKLDIHLAKLQISQLVPNLSKSLVDEDSNVRETVISVFRELFDTCSRQSIPITAFLPLHTAYISASLDSLDAYMRRDGIRAVEIVANVYPLFIKDGIEKLLPAYLQVLKDSRGGVFAGTKKKDSNTNVSEQCLVLRSMVALLQSAGSKRDLFLSDEKISIIKKKSLILCRTPSTHSLEMSDDNDSKCQTFLLALDTTLAFAQTLRDSWVELSQQHSEVTDDGLIISSLSNLEEFSLLLTSMQLMYEYFFISAFDHYKSLTENKQQEQLWKKFLCTLQNLPVLLLEHFPLLSEHKNETVHLTNLKYCHLLCQMGNSDALLKEKIEDDEFHWTSQVIEYLTTSFETTQNLKVTKAEVSLLAKLLLPISSDNNTYILAETNRTKVLDIFLNHFIMNPAKKSLSTDEIINTIVSPSKALHLLCSLLHQSTLEHEHLKLAINQIPFFLNSIEQEEMQILLLNALLFNIRQCKSYQGNDVIYNELINVYIDEHVNKQVKTFIKNEQPWNVTLKSKYSKNLAIQTRVIGILSLLVM